MNALGLDEALAGLASRLGVAAALVPVEATTRAAGEAAAQLALRARGCSIDDGWVLRHAGDGRPLWLRGCTGSIAHTDSVAVAAVSRVDERVAAIGIDVERAAALPEEDAVVVLAAGERAQVQNHAEPDWLATLLWSAKESAFKAWSHATEGELGTVDPVDIVVAVDETGRALRVCATGLLAPAIAPFGDAVGGYVEADGCVVTLVTVAPPASAG